MVPGLLSDDITSGWVSAHRIRIDRMPIAIRFGSCFNVSFAADKKNKEDKNKEDSGST
jgi:hypothetical protein